MSGLIYISDGFYVDPSCIVAIQYVSEFLTVIYCAGITPLTINLSTDEIKDIIKNSLKIDIERKEQVVANIEQLARYQQNTAL